MLNAVKWVVVLVLGSLAVGLAAMAEAPRPKTEREWKRFLVATRLKEGSTRGEVEKRLGTRVIEELNRDHGFALFRDVYYELDADWCVYVFYRSPGGANITADTPRVATRLVVEPKVIRNTPASRKYIR